MSDKFMCIRAARHAFVAKLGTRPREKRGLEMAITQQFWRPSRRPTPALFCGRIGEPANELKSGRDRSSGARRRAVC
ncbi:protein of unknown function [Burkholderia multivorans]